MLAMSHLCLTTMMPSKHNTELYTMDTSAGFALTKSSIYQTA